DEFGQRGVSLIGIAPGGLDTPADLDRFATAHGIRFPILRDTDGIVTARIGARRTPEVVVLDDRRAIRYRGRIDDQSAVGSRRSEARRRDLVEALEELLGGRAVSRPETEPVGCPIDRPVKSPSSVETTYNRDIAPILRRR